MAQSKHVPYVPASMEMKEFTLRALLIGLFLSVLLGAANAYLGLKAGMTIAATYPAAVLGMALLKLMKGSILEENFTRTVGSIGESVAAGAIFTLPAFFIAGIWKPFFTPGNYMTSTLILVAGGVLGIMFVALLRRVMVEDADLLFPESVAAAEIHKSGQGHGQGGSKFLFSAMGVGALVQGLGQLKLFPINWEKFYGWFSDTVIPGTAFKGKGGMLISTPGISPAYMGVGYIIGPKYASLNFSGGLLAWGLLTPIIYYFIAPWIDTTFLTNWANVLISADPSLPMDKAMERVSDAGWQINQVWRLIVRPIAIGGMLMGALFTLFKMRKSLGTGLARSVADVKKAASGSNVHVDRTEKDLPFVWIMVGIFAIAVLTFFITKYIFGTGYLPAFVAATVLIVLAFFFAAISGYLVGIIGSSNNPISGLTLTALVITALILVAIGVDSSNGGVAAVLGVAAIVCVAAAVSGEMLQDLKAGHILGGTPWKMQVGDIIGVLLAAAVMFGVLHILNQADIADGIRNGYEGGFGSKSLSAPQAGLMAMLSKGIVGGNMAWPLIIVGLFMGMAFIMMQVKSPMLVSVGMYLPLETTFAIFIGGLVKGVVDMIIAKRGYNEAQQVRIENVGILLASGLIAGEALPGLGFAPLKILEINIPAIFADPPVWMGLLVLVAIALILIYIPLKNPGKADEPAPPKAM